ncbi:MAG: DUF1616 domain-containing protein [Methanophagales archaeon]|nr:DUF1616 domain-containing protein [Methanophagales archaeon]MCW3142212.1 DUF1616 domain-containing protein [Methanophagales archaeon]
MIERINKAIPKNDLIFIVAFVITSVVIITIPPLNGTPLRAVVGFPLVLFLPGYSLVSALFPGKDELDLLERIALSIGLSICIVVFIGLGLNYTPWGIRLGPVLLVLSVFTLIGTAVSALRRMG